ncbi:MAG: DUF131 domain-containing protein [Candidatus Thermoplasmatota archaeon]|nr:DUF131 domain-containing protein [Candidatus Thermoplasmatota archaeon]
MCLIAASVATGEAALSLVVIIPVISGTGGVFLLGMLLIVTGLVLGFALVVMGQTGWEDHQEPERTDESGLHQARREKREARYGGMVLIGPVPIAFGSNMRIAIAMLVVGIIIAVVTLALILFTFN